MIYVAWYWRSFHTLELVHVALLVERNVLQAERVDDVVDSDLAVVQSLLGLLSGSVGTNVCFVGIAWSAAALGYQKYKKPQK